MPKKTTTPRRSIRRRTSDYYIVTDMQSGQVLGRLVDLSQNGFQIIASEELSGSTYDCKLSLPRPLEDIKEVPLQASLKWCHRNNQWDWYEAGFQIDLISSSSFKVLQQIIEIMMHNESAKLNT